MSTIATTNGKVKKLGRPSFTPELLRAMKETPSGEEVRVNKSFKSYEAAWYYKQEILKSSPRAKVSIRPVQPEWVFEDGVVTQVGKGYYLVLGGRGRKAAA